MAPSKRSISLAAVVAVAAVAAMSIALWAVRGDSVGATSTHHSKPGGPSIQAAPQPDPIRQGSYVEQESDSSHPMSVVGPYTRSHLRENFDSHIDLAERGDPESMLIIAEVARNCILVGSFKSWDQLAASNSLIQTGQMPQDILDEMKPTFESLVDDCSYVNSHVPVDKSYSDWSGDWYKKAAAAGSSAARLERLAIEANSDDNFGSMATLLNDSISSGDYRFFYLASMFYAKYFDQKSNSDPNNTVGMTWQYLGCLHHTECDAAAMRRELDAAYLPVDVARIVNSAAHIEQGNAKVDFFSLSTFDQSD